MTPPAPRDPRPPGHADGAGWAWPAAAALAALLPFWPVALGYRLAGMDLSFHWWPMHLWARRALAGEGSLLWDGYTALGQPAAADPARHVFFPPALLARLLPAELGFTLLVVAPFVVIALAGYALARGEGVGPRWAALAGAVCALAGPVQSTASMPNLSWSVALGLAAVAAASSPRWQASAILWALAALAGEAITLSLFAALALALAARHGRAAVLRAAGAGLLGAALAAVQFAPMAVAALDAQRGGPAHLFGPPRWVGLWHAGLAGEPLALGYQAMRSGLLVSVYLGAAALLLALAARGRGVVLWAGAAAAGLALAVGDYLPFWRAAELVLVGGRWPEKALALVVVAVAVLAALGLERVALRSVPVAAAAAALVVVDLAGAAVALHPAVPRELMEAPGWVAALPQGARVHVGGTDLAGGGTGPAPRAEAGLTVSPSPVQPTVELVKSAYRTYSAPYTAAYGLGSAISPDMTALYPPSYRAISARYAAAPPGERRRFLAAMGVEAVLASAPPRNALAQVYSDARFAPRGLYRVPSLGRAWLASEISDSPEPLFAGPLALVGAPVAWSLEGGAVTAVETVVPAGGAWLVVADSFSREWGATVDGREAEVRPAFGALRAVWLEAGARRVVFEHRPRAVYAGTGVSAAALLFLAWSLHRSSGQKNLET